MPVGWCHPPEGGAARGGGGPRAGQHRRAGWPAVRAAACQPAAGRAWTLPGHATRQPHGQQDRARPPVKAVLPEKHRRRHRHSCRHALNRPRHAQRWRRARSRAIERDRHHRQTSSQEAGPQSFVKYATDCSSGAITVAQPTEPEHPSRVAHCAGAFQAIAAVALKPRAARPVPGR